MDNKFKEEEIEEDIQIEEDEYEDDNKNNNKITSKKDIKLKVNLKDSTLPKEKYCNNEFFYYQSADISGGTIEIILNDNSYTNRPGIKTLKRIKKYQVDPIGNITKVNREKRMYFN